MNALTLLQTLVATDCPTGAEIARGDVVVPPHVTEVVVLIPPKVHGGSWLAAGPFPLADMEWARLRPGYRVYWPKD